MQTKALQVTNETLQHEARELDEEIRGIIRQTKHSFVRLGQAIATMRDKRLWWHLLDSRGNRKYDTLQGYVISVMGPMARGKYFQIVAAHTLTEGENAIAPKVVEQMGIVKAAQIARLSPKDRDPEIIQSALKDTVPIVKLKVQAKLNASLPPDEHLEPTATFVISLPLSTLQALEELIEVGIWMEGIRDSDRTQSMRQKFLGAMIVATREYYSVELAEALDYKLAREAIQAAPAGQSLEPENELETHGDQNVPEEG
jgi:hypothetical protein